MIGAAEFQADAAGKGGPAITNGLGQASVVAITVPPDLLDALAVRLAQIIPSPQIHPDASPWLTVIQAARRAGYECRNGRAPATMYGLAKQIGKRVGNKWMIHVSDLDQAIRDGLAG